MKYGVHMHLSHEDWLRVPLLLESLRGMFKDSPDEELAYLKRLAIGEQKKASDQATTQHNTSTGTNGKGEYGKL